MENIYLSTIAAAKIQENAYNLKGNKEERENALNTLERQGYTISTPSEKMALYEYKAAKIFTKSVEALQSEIMDATVIRCEIETFSADESENEVSEDER